MKICRAQALGMVAVIAIMLVTPSQLLAQQADVDPAPATPRPGTPRPETQGQQTSPSPSSDNATPSHDPQTQDTLAFTGRVEREKGQIVLNDPVTKVSYFFDNQLRAKQFLGRRVKVTGKLELSSNRIHIESIEVMP